MPINLNRVQLIGQVSRVKTHKSKLGNIYMTFSLCVNTPYVDESGKQNYKKEFTQVIANEWVIVNKCRKLENGSVIFLLGRLASRAIKRTDKNASFKSRVVWHAYSRVKADDIQVLFTKDKVSDSPEDFSLDDLDSWTY